MFGAPTKPGVNLANVFTTKGHRLDAMIVWFMFKGQQCNERVATTNANFARDAIQKRYPEARVGLVLASPGRR